MLPPEHAACDSLFLELWHETAERPEAAPANGIRARTCSSGGEAERVQRRGGDGAAATTSLQLGVRPCSCVWIVEASSTAWQQEAGNRWRISRCACLLKEKVGFMGCAVRGL